MGGAQRKRPIRNELYWRSKKMTASPENITTVDTHYLNPVRMASYLVREGDRAVFVDVGPETGVTYLLAALAEQGLSPESVDYVIVTHAHLDHAAGTASLLQHCPNAKMVAHPKAARHLISPERLIAGSKAVYGDELFHQLYGEVLPVPEEKVVTVEDNETLSWGGRDWRFLHTLGHATHHIAIYDPGTECVFTGDNFGIGLSSLYREGPSFLICTCPPPEFDAVEAEKSVDRIIATGATWAAPAHFGLHHGVAENGEKLKRSIRAMGALVEEALEKGLEDGELSAFLDEGLRAAAADQIAWCGVRDPQSDLAWLEADLALNIMGLNVAVSRRRKAAQ